MIFDTQSMFSLAQPITATIPSTAVYVVGSGPVSGASPAVRTGTAYCAASPLDIEIGKGGEVPLFCGTVEGFNNLTSLTISIEIDDNYLFTSPTTIFVSPAYGLADLVPGARQLLPERVPIGVREAYMRLKYTLAGTAPTLGKITAGVTAGNQSRTS